MEKSVFFDFIPYGGDYNPDQWPREIWEKDMDMLKEAGVNFLTLPVFSWAKLQPSEEQFNFGWLDEAMDLFGKSGMKVCLATPTAAQPPWMSKRYPDILPVDIEGRKRVHGKRINFCPNSPSYRKFSLKMAVEMANRYKDHPALGMWHISNEYGTHCYCDTCRDAFQVWLKDRYKTVENLNEKWNSAFWGHLVYDFNEVTVPSKLNDEDVCSPAKALDYKRFMTDSLMGCFSNEREAVREISPDVPATTNITGYIERIDLYKMAELVDVIGWDSYPGPAEDLSVPAFKHEIMRGLKGGQSYYMIEESPNQQNWQPYNALKRPGEVRRMSYQALGKGSDAVMFFQMRASRGGVEKFHGAFIPHDGGTDNRIFKEMTQLGDELKTLGSRFLGARTEAKAALLFDWDNWWAADLSSGPSVDLKYFEQVNAYYKAFYEANYSVDIVKPGADLSKYSVVAAPVLYMVTEKTARTIDAFVSGGGSFITTYFSGMTDENDYLTDKGFPGLLREIMGIRAEELDALLPGVLNRMNLEKAFLEEPGTSVFSKSVYNCGLLCDLIHAEGADVLAAYGRDFYAGRPAITRNRYGKGQAYYLASFGEEAFISDFIRYALTIKGIEPEAAAPGGMEVSARYKGNTEFLFIINHSQKPGTVRLKGNDYTDSFTGKKTASPVSVEAGEILLLERKRVFEG